MHFLWHVGFGFLVRVILIIFAQWYDTDDSGINYTDIDYKVFTDAAQHMWHGESPYMRPTYRYTPLIAILLLPNVFLHYCWGKLLFSIFDLAIAYTIQKIVSKSHPKSSDYCAFLWLYNPLSIVISTRGNADSISCFIVLLTLLIHLKKKYLLSAIFLALSVHIRIYPILFCLSYYLSIDIKLKSTSLFKKNYRALFPTKNKITFVMIFCVSTISINGFCYYFYGQKFLDESYLYHVSRLDVRHNFSVYFYLNYLLSSSDNIPLTHSILTKLFPLLLILVVSFTFYNVEDLAFCQFCLCFIMVTYNTVVTSQYFVWFVSFLPVCYLNINITFIEGIKILLIWILPQIGWLTCAYLLEFLGVNTFSLLWIESLMFYLSNIVILSFTIERYKCNELKKIL
ncbi:GPI mannosyltransferase 1 [Daktulosphaira vitifoliae]|uniref:GPI mannosyltransferase 1 n=1 Tax=Daktulosphaira vitifoliae TaxID=58002 RepID=UPI0021AAD330|nr:GPI mannosyltransferase 1 [Daktulosphaira vitifoliae]